MNATGPPKSPIILGSLINVEESRAHRLQRQQARFRDRGGIFVPTNRSTLLDILLGKTSSLKKPRRSASASPSRANQDKSSSGSEVSRPALRRSPRKQSQKILDVVTDDLGSEVSKPIDKATSSNSSKLRPQNKAKVPPKCTTIPRIAASEKKSLKVSPKKIIPNADDASEDGISLKLRPKGKAIDTTKAQAEGAKRMLKTRGRKPTTVTTSAAVTSPTRLERANNIDPVYSEDDAACTPTKKAATKKVKRSAASLEEITSKTPSAQKGKGFSNLKQTVPREEHNSKKDASSTCKEKKRGSVFIAQDSNSQPRRKRIKSGTTETDIDPFLHKNSDLSDKAPLITSKKRRRNLEDAEREVEDGAGKSTKRKKHSTPSESRQAPEIIVEEDSMKPVMKTSTKTKVTKSTRKGKKQSSNNGTTASKRKENTRMSKPSKVASKSGPPKSVLQRIKNSLGAQAVDNEPDPIDFLS